MSMENSNDTISNRTRDLPAYLRLPFVQTLTAPTNGCKSLILFGRSWVQNSNQWSTILTDEIWKLPCTKTMLLTYKQAVTRKGGELQPGSTPPPQDRILKIRRFFQFCRHDDFGSFTDLTSSRNETLKLTDD
jgi:hypothetical protein